MYVYIYIYIILFLFLNFPLKNLSMTFLIQHLPTIRGGPSFDSHEAPDPWIVVLSVQMWRNYIRCVYIYTHFSKYSYIHSVYLYNRCLNYHNWFRVDFLKYPTIPKTISSKSFIQKFSAQCPWVRGPQDVELGRCRVGLCKQGQQVKPPSVKKRLQYEECMETRRREKQERAHGKDVDVFYVFWMNEFRSTTKKGLSEVLGLKLGYSMDLDTFSSFHTVPLFGKYHSFKVGKALNFPNLEEIQIKSRP